MSRKARIFIGDRDVTDFSPRQRDIAMVFQNYALYPHMTVRKNLGYGLKVRRHAEARDRAAGDRRRSKLLGLDDLLERRPAALSGGQRQRVAMGRAIVREPAAYLMDEPLSNLDAKLRVAMRAELARLHERLSTTTVYVTHDQIEAMTLGQRVTVMRDGLIQQVGPPQQLYRRPRQPVRRGVHRLAVDEPRRRGRRRRHRRVRGLSGFRSRPAGVRSVTGRVILGIRPDDFEDVAHADPGLPAIDVRVSVARGARLGGCT